MPSPSNKSRVFLPILTVLLVSIIYLSLNWVGIIDDAYIFLRYAENISRGYGYVFNIGQPVEGTTSVTWTILLAVLDLLHIPAEISVKILGALCILAITILLGVGFYKANISPLTMLVVFALLVFDKNFVPSLMMGMENGLYALLLLVVCLASGWYLRGKGWFPAIVMGGTGILLFLTRPESMVLLVLIGCGMLFFRHESNVRNIAIPILIWVMGILVVTSWRWFVFGDFIPNSVRAKSVIELSLLHWPVLWSRVVAGYEYIQDVFLTSWPLVILGLVGLASMRKRFEGYVAFCALLLGITTVLTNAGDWMPFSRLLTPYLPVLAFFAGIGLDRLRLSLSERWIPVFELALLLIIVWVTGNAFWLLRGRVAFVAPGWPNGKCYRKAGLALRPYLSGSTLVAPEAVGELGYILGDIPILDIFGLTEPYIARHGVIPIETYNFGRHDYEYVMQKNPGLFFFHSDISNHIPLLNRWNYSQQYETFRITDGQINCKLLVGVKNSLVPMLLPVLKQNFEVQLVDTRAVQANPAATWPEGER